MCRDRDARHPEAQAAFDALLEALRGQIPDLVRVPGAELAMGNQSGPLDEQPVHPVQVAQLRVDDAAVTVADDAECVATKGCQWALHAFCSSFVMPGTVGPRPSERQAPQRLR